MTTSLEHIEQLLSDQGAQPPIERWDPPLSGDIDIVIDEQGRWFHEGGEIERLALVKLFASILRCEADCQHYLVTPVEKWRIQVEDTPLLIVDFEETVRDGRPALLLEQNLGRRQWLDAEHPLVLEVYRGLEIPRQLLSRGLSARLNRSTYYQLVERAREAPLADGRPGLVLESCGDVYPLGRLG